MFREFLSRLLRLKSVDAKAPAWTHLKARVGHRFFDDLLPVTEPGIPGIFEPCTLRGVLPYDARRDLIGVSFDGLLSDMTVRLALTRKDALSLCEQIIDSLSQATTTAASSESADFLDGLTDERFKAMLDEARNGGSDLPKTRDELNAVIDERIRSQWVRAQSDVGTRFA